MAEQMLMKDGLGSAAIKRIGNSLAQVVPQFNARAFQKDAAQGLDHLELKARVYHLIDVLHRHYDLPFKKLSKHLHHLPEVWDRGSAADNKAGFAAWPIIDYVAVHGLQHPVEALHTLEKLTPLFSAEFAIRPFIQHHYDITYQQLLRWCDHPSEHVRRLASEGSRPRLPWGAQLPQFIKDPTPLAPLLEKLNRDESLYVRRSVANSLNDISKDNPDWMVALCERWAIPSHEHTDWIIKHALRSLVKAGDARVFPLLGYAAKPSVTLSEITLNKNRIKVGDSIGFSCELSAGNKAQNLVVDYVVYFMKASGKLASKVFKLKNLALAKNERVIIVKNHSFKLITTRRYYAGEHQLAIQVNGREVVRTTFYLSE
jgi:3-methyladenine DNA glycosylase AlkC